MGSFTMRASQSPPLSRHPRRCMLRSPLFLLLLALLFSTHVQGSPSPLGGQTSCETAPDIIFYNGVIITMDPGNPQAEAVAVKGGLIQAVGSNNEILSLLIPGCGARVVDLRGLALLPGFNDSHTHWFSWRQHICSVGSDTTYPSLEEIMHMLSQKGWTSISELNFGRPDVVREHLENALDLDGRGELSVRLNGYWGTLSDPSLIQALADSGIAPRTAYTNRIRVPGVKMYIDDPFGTTDIMTQEEVNQLVQLAHAGGWQIAAHAVNQSAVEKILSAYELVLGSESNENYRYRVEHAVKVSDDQLNRMKLKGIVASFQLMGPPDWPAQATFQTYISNTHPEWCLRWSDFDAAVPEGLRITGSTDAPFNDTPCDYSPFRVIYQAVTREGYLSRAHAGWELAQRLSIQTGIRLLTSDGAYATFEENVKGSLSPGKVADLVIVSENPLDVSAPEDLLTIRTQFTMVGGEVEYCDTASNPGLCPTTESFRIDSTLVSAAAYLPDFTPDLAFDDNPSTIWNSGADAPQWIEVDLLKNLQITRIELQVAQYPAGRTVHQIWARGDDPLDTLVLLAAFDGLTQEGQLLTYITPPGLPPYRHVRILTTESPSWVAWEEIVVHTQNLTGVLENNPPIPLANALLQNYPNPFNPNTTIGYSVAGPRAEVIRLAVYDLLGREVAVLVNGKKEPGRYEAIFDASVLPSSVYLYKLTAGSFVQTRKMIFIR